MKTGVYLSPCGQYIVDLENHTYENLMFVYYGKDEPAICLTVIELSILLLHWEYLSDS